jgi:hypothetical protein
LVFLILLLTVSACSRRENPETQKEASPLPLEEAIEEAAPAPLPPPEEEPAIPSLPAFPSPGQRQTPGRQEPGERGQPPPPREGSRPAPQGTRVYQNKEDPLFAPPSTPRLPSDFAIGLLSLKNSPESRVRQTRTLFVAFLEALNKGTDLSRYLHPDYKPFLQRSLAQHKNLKSAIKKFRIGEIRFSTEGPAMAETAFLLFGPQGRARGQILAEISGNVWYIAGIACDFDDLFVPSRTGNSEEAFDPGPPDFSF